MSEVIPVSEFQKAKSRKSKAGSPPPASPDDALPPEYSEERLALAFVERHHSRLRYVALWSRWFSYQGTVWKQDGTLEIFDLVRSLCRSVAAGCPERKIATLIASAKTVSAVERLARSDRRVAATIEQWDADPWLLNTPDGVVDLKTGIMRPTKPEDYMTKCTSVAPGGEWEAWHEFLAKVTDGNDEQQAYLRRLVGYALTGDMSDHVLAFAHGTGANGKSVFINTIAGIMGDYHRSTSASLFMESHHEQHPTELASLRGARLVTATEVEEGRRWKEGLIKLVTGGDIISARFMRQDNFEFKSTAKLVFVGNHQPALRNVDEAMRRRLHLIPFNITIPPSERDPDLSRKLQNEWPGILDWAIKGCLDWQAKGLVPPAAVKDATSHYFENQDAFGSWLDDRCERNAQAWTSSTDLFNSWRGWATDAGEFVGNTRRFMQGLENRGFMSVRRMYGRGFAGIRLKEKSGDDQRTSL